jgi:hypothetical protein
LAKRDESDQLRGSKLRERIAHIAAQGWYTELGRDLDFRVLPKPSHVVGYLEHVELDNDVFDVVKDLWDNVRNPLAHSTATFFSLDRDPQEDMLSMERIVVAMMHAWVSAWRLEDFTEEKSAYDLLLE